MRATIIHLTDGSKHTVNFNLPSLEEVYKQIKNTEYITFADDKNWLIFTKHIVSLSESD